MLHREPHSFVKFNDAIFQSPFSVIHRQTGAEGALKIIIKESRNSELEVKLHAYASQCENVRESSIIRL